MPENNRALATRPNPQYGRGQALDTDAAKEQYLKVSDKEFYNARGGGGKSPSARLAKKWGLEDNISCEVMEYGADKDKAWAKVKAWIGEKENPTVVREDAVVLVYQDMLAAAVFEAIENGVSVTTGFDQDGKRIAKKIQPTWEIGENNMPVITDPQAQLSVLKTYMEKRKFACRAAVSTAKRRIFLELIDKDHGDQDGDGLDVQGDAPPVRGSRPNEQKPKAQPEDKRPPQGPSGEAEDPELVEYRRIISSELMSRNGGEREGAMAELEAITKEMALEGAVAASCRLPARITKKSEAKAVVDVILAQNNIRDEFLRAASGRVEAAEEDFSQMMEFLRLEDPSVPNATSPLEIYSLNVLTRILATHVGQYEKGDEEWGTQGVDQSSELMEKSTERTDDPPTKEQHDG